MHTFVLENLVRSSLEHQHLLSGKLLEHKVSAPEEQKMPNMGSVFKKNEQKNSEFLKSYQSDLGNAQNNNKKELSGA